jgi:hypothetical protein
MCCEYNPLSIKGYHDIQLSNAKQNDIYPITQDRALITVIMLSVILLNVVASSSVVR